ncbi:VOC family protein [Gemmatimonas sp.]|jgi:catechol 2,3-dioxygenase-like lactoylglutathione lyase family enzyme|uniref:VOC family protein n=1 Tax=Gemmatimonas sp. TaxID=1962908 RepID=UPI0037C14914
MLSASSPIAFIATAAPERARAFYADTLGLPLVSEDDFSLVFALHGIALRIQKVPELQPQAFTALGWQVADAAATVAALRSRGVQFERYPFLPQDADDIWEAPGGARIAWFRDPDGNLLSLTEVRTA